MFAVEETDEDEDVVQVIALKEHEPEEPDQLTLSPGDVIQITGPETDGKLWVLEKKLVFSLPGASRPRKNSVLLMLILPTPYTQNKR